MGVPGLLLEVVVAPYEACASAAAPVLCRSAAYISGALGISRGFVAVDSGGAGCCLDGEETEPCWLR